MSDKAYDSLDSPVGSAGSPARPSKMFAPLVILAQVLGLAAVILTAVWMGHYRGGFAWTSDPDHQFNYHPLLMIIGMVFLYGNAILVYRVFRNEKKFIIKLLHAILLCLSLVFSAVGLKAVFDFHNLTAKPNLYSLHSWLGIALVGMFALQWVLGFLMFLLPVCAESIKAAYKKVHVYFGLLMFIMAVMTSLTGITEKIIFSMADARYTEYSAEGMVVNCLGLVLVALVFVVSYLVLNPEFARQPTPEEERIQLHQ